MNAPVIAFFNNKGEVGTTSLVYHLAWMMAGKGLRVVAADLDPQANLTLHQTRGLTGCAEATHPLTGRVATGPSTSGFH